MINYLTDANFLSSRKDECIGEESYFHALDVWIIFKKNTMGELS